MIPKRVRSRNHTPARAIGTRKYSVFLRKGRTTDKHPVGILTCIAAEGNVEVVGGRDEVEDVGAETRKVALFPKHGQTDELQQLITTIRAYLGEV